MYKKQKDERTLQMMKQYVELHNSGLTPQDIAKRFNLHVSIIYRYLQEIADAAGVSRESLLQTPRSNHVTHLRTFEPVSLIDPKEFNEHLANAVQNVDDLIQRVSRDISAQTRITEIIDEEVKTWQTK